jgi:fermentation-respiration switch protein FrsA (DUF1100 family)
MPILLFHGEKDEVIPAAHSRTLLKAVSAPSKAVFFPGTGHNDFDTAAISEHVLDFAHTHNLIA